MSDPCQGAPAVVFAEMPAKSAFLDLGDQAPEPPPKRGGDSVTGGGDDAATSPPRKKTSLAPVLFLAGAAGVATFAAMKASR